MTDFYQILGISRYASQAEIKNAYKNLAKQYHPDKHPGSSYHEEQFKLINEAYHTLADANKKQQYDYRLQYQNLQNSSNSATGDPKTTKSPKAKKKQPAPPAKGSNRSFYLITISFFVLAVFGSWAMYYYMNRYAAREKLAEAKAQIKIGNMRRAHDLLIDALDFDETLAEAHYWKGRVIIPLIGKYERAAEYYTNAISNCDTVYTDAYFERAKAYIRLEKYSSALSDFGLLAAQASVRDSLYWYRGELHYFLDNYEKANQDFEKFLSLRPDCGDCLSKIIYGEIQRHHFREASEKYKEAARSKQDTSLVSPLLLAIAYIGQRDSSLALQYIRLLEEGSLQKKSANELFQSLYDKK